jgi:hypothetical protein
VRPATSGRATAMTGQEPYPTGTHLAISAITENFGQLDITLRGGMPMVAGAPLRDLQSRVEAL